MRKPKPMKGVKVIYDGVEYTNITHFSRGYDYSNFSYLDDNGAECSIYINASKSFQIINEN